MSIISSWDWPRFEKWVIENYPGGFEQWELEASEFVDLDDWLLQEHFHVIGHWRKNHPQQEPK